MFALYFLLYLCITYYILTPRSRDFLEMLTGSQPVKKYPEFYATRKFITAFTSARHLSLSWASSIQSKYIPLSEDPSYYYLPIYVLVSQVVSFPSGFPTKPLYRISCSAQNLDACVELMMFSIVRDVFTYDILFIEDLWDIEFMKLNKRARI